MCGIGGIIAQEPELEPIARVLMSSMLHRGPDHQATATAEGAAFAHTRLALIDDEGGRQPMQRGPWTIVYNGEVYNHAQLRAQLREHWDFRTRSDTEVVLAAYSVWGPSALPRLNGMFSFLIFHAPSQTAFAARDRLGIKPFVFAHEQQRFLFASEAKALLKTGLIKAKLDDEAVQEYFLAPCFSGVERPVFAGLRYLPPGSWLRYTPRELTVRRWWRPKLATRALAEPQALQAALRKHLQRAVSRALVSDHPIGAYLSGGLDSTSLVALMPTPTCFTIHFEGQSAFDYARAKIVISDDTPFAEEAARALNLRWAIVPAPQRDHLPALRTLAQTNDFLPAFEQELTQHYLAKAAAQHFKAVVVGDAADETHCGYHFLLSKTANQDFRTLLSQFVPFDPERLGHLAQKYTSLVESLDCDPKDRVRATTYLILERWLPRLLQNGDIHSMRHSLEQRVPFADSELLDLALSIPAELAYRNGVEKSLLREAVRGLIPESIRRRRKSALPKDQGPTHLYQRALGDLLEDRPECLRAYLPLEPLRKLARPELLLSEAERGLVFRALCFDHFRAHYGV